MGWHKDLNFSRAGKCRCLDSTQQIENLHDLADLPLQGVSGNPKKSTTPQDNPLGPVSTSTFDF